MSEIFKKPDPMTYNQVHNKLETNTEDIVIKANKSEREFMTLHLKSSQKKNEKVEQEKEKEEEEIASRNMKVMRNG